MATKNQGSAEMDLSTEDVLRILETSAKSGVTVLKFGGLYAKFGKQTEPPETPRPGTQGPEPLPHKPVADMTAEEFRKIAKASLEQGELEFREALIEELKITNPMLYEELIRTGDLSDDINDDSDGGDQPE